jgi:hypothetical protein
MDVFLSADCALSMSPNGLLVNVRVPTAFTVSEISLHTTEDSSTSFNFMVLSVW